VQGSWLFARIALLVPQAVLEWEWSQCSGKGKGDADLVGMEEGKVQPHLAAGTTLEATGKVGSIGITA
jgi:hypothetical protein